MCHLLYGIFHNVQHTYVHRQSMGLASFVGRLVWTTSYRQRLTIRFEGHATGVMNNFGEEEAGDT